jgi:hypothetical protein
MTFKKIYIPSKSVIIIITMVILSSIFYATFVLTYGLTYGKNNTNTNTDTNNNTLIDTNLTNNQNNVCERITSIYSLAFFGNLMVLYGVFTKYISCIKESSNAILILYISFIFYLIITAIIFGFIQLNDCLRFYKEDIYLKIYNLVAIQYISCTILLGTLAIDYTIYFVNKNHQNNS